jgi:hypothetical protein
MAFLQLKRLQTASNLNDETESVLRYYPSIYLDKQMKHTKRFKQDTEDLIGSLNHQHSLHRLG